MTMFPGHAKPGAPHDHVVQLHADDAVLARNVGRYLCDGLIAGQSGIVIATADHTAALREDLATRGVDVSGAERARTILFLDARQTLSKFMIRGRPDQERFDQTISNAVQSLPRGPGRMIRAYGEMVGILWANGEYSAAIRLEEHWNRILAGLNATLFCAYPIDVFGPDFEASAVHAILCDHSHLVPSGDSAAMEQGLLRAMRHVLGERYARIREGMNLNCPSEWGVVPPAERTILWIHEHLPEAAPQILQIARGYCNASTGVRISL
jgi:hypothetical protein